MKQNTWKEFIINEARAAYFLKLKEFLDNEKAKKNIFPPEKEMFRCFEYAEIDDVLVVIIGQDPYFRPFQANGLAFSVNKGIKLPPSLRNIYKELVDDLQIDFPTHGDLTAWARQGILLLNQTLSVEEGKPMSHQNKGWEIFIAHVMQKLNNHNAPKVFLLWGKEAQKLEKMIDNPRHLILKSSHPSPLSASRGFFKNKHFSKTTAFIKQHRHKNINWQL